MLRLRSADTLRAALAERDVSHRELARLAGCSHGVPGKLLAGGRARPALARAIAKALRIELDELFEAAPTSNTEQQDEDRQAVGA